MRNVVRGMPRPNLGRPNPKFKGENLPLAKRIEKTMEMAKILWQEYGMAHEIAREITELTDLTKEEITTTELKKIADKTGYDEALVAAFYQIMKNENTNQEDPDQIAA